MFGELATAGATLLSGFLGKSSQDKALDFQKDQFEYQKQLNEANNIRQDIQRAQDWQNDQWMAQAGWNFTNAQREAAQNYATNASALAWQRQMEADNTRVQRLVKDAGAAGIHPLAALGAQLSSPMAQVASPAYSGGAGSRGSAGSGSVTGFIPMSSPDGNPLGDAIANAVRSLSDATSAASDEALKAAQIRNLDAETVATLASARSRTVIRAARASAQGGPGSGASRHAVQGHSVPNIGNGGRTEVPVPGYRPETTWDDIVNSLNQAVRSLVHEATRNVAPKLTVVPSKRPLPSWLRPPTH